MGKLVWGVAGVLAVALVGALAYAPYLPQMLGEGLPELMRGDRGQFAALEGAPVPRDLAVREDAGRPLTPELAALFADSEGAAFLVARAGQLEIEHYGAGANAETEFNSFSMAKSLVGALVYTALAEGRIGSLDTRLGAYLPEVPALADVSLRSLITMRASIHFDTAGGMLGASSGKDSDIAPNPFGPLARLHYMGIDAIEAGLTPTVPASDVFNYQNVNTALLGRVLESVYQQKLETLLNEQIWEPAGASTAVWRHPAGSERVSAYCCIYAKARDWVRVGMFLAENGTPDAPFLPEALWREFLGLDTSPELRSPNHYGAHIQQNILDREGQALQGPFSFLFGQNGQVLYLMPQERLVVYRAGASEQLLHSTLYDAWNMLAAE